MNKLGKLVKAHRLAEGLTLRALAPMIGMKSYSSLSNKEGAKRNARFVAAQFPGLVAALPGLTMADLLEAQAEDKMEAAIRKRPGLEPELLEARALARMIAGRRDGELIPLLRDILKMKRRAETAGRRDEVRAERPMVKTGAAYS